MRIVTGATKLCSIAKLYEETGWATLETRRNVQKLIILIDYRVRFMERAFGELINFI